MFDVEVVTAGSFVVSILPLVFVYRIGVDGSVTTHASSLKASDLLWISREYRFPQSFRLVVPQPEDRACWPPVGFVGIYEDSPKGGLRVPYPTIYTELQHFLGISIAQLYPNAIRQITGLTVISSRRDFPLTLGLLNRFFKFMSNGDRFYLVPQFSFRVETNSKVLN